MLNQNGLSPEGRASLLPGITKRKVFHKSNWYSRRLIIFCPSTNYKQLSKTLQIFFNGNACSSTDFKIFITSLTRFHQTTKAANLSELPANPITPSNDLHLISPYNVTPESSIKVTRIKEMITK